MENQYPTMPRRYLATLIDGILILSVFISTVYIIPQENETARILRIGIAIFMFFIYEPLHTSKLCTLGQKIMGIRVRGYEAKTKTTSKASQKESNTNVRILRFSYER